MTTGRPRSFGGPTTKVSMVVPKDTAVALRIMAAEHGVSISQLIDDWTRKARLAEAVERGRQAIADGDVLEHQEVGVRLRNWTR
jgi:hypothetical protein